ncbi:DNA polymerase III subunit beta [Paenibacillus albidus]|uniref:Beta sliding clamp n=1 Tax=Paenibacillus albidus TaxID=2041023 RepID=A0A917C6K5_9BACL|nr:DNA polymerase III subunit beta [Paenibacillus albidus]GGF73232.1 DNA polymerase III subunit beta [Paenibacillus albidus]
MKISIDKHILYKPLEQAAKFLPSKTVIPILGELLFEAKPEGLYITGGNGMQFLRTKIEPDDYQLIKAGSVTIPGSRITEIVKAMKGVIDIETSGHETEIKSGRKKYDLPSLEADEYPEFIEDPEGASVEIEGKTLKVLVKETAYAASEREETPILTGLRLRFQDNMINVTSTDRHRLSSSVQVADNVLDMQIIVGAKTMSDLMKLIAPEEKISIKLVQSKLVVVTKNFIFCSRVLEGAYPDVDRIVPTSYLSTVRVNRDSMIEALQSVKIIVKDEKSKLTRMYVGEIIELKAAAEGVGKVNEFVDIISLQGEGFKVAFNGEYVLEAAESINSKEIIIGYSGMTNPILIKDADDERNYRIVLPYRTTEV